MFDREDKDKDALFEAINSLNPNGEGIRPSDLTKFMVIYQVVA
jgi:hypothetical protein